MHLLLWRFLWEVLSLVGDDGRITALPGDDLCPNSWAPYPSMWLVGLWNVSLDLHIHELIVFVPKNTFGRTWSLDESAIFFQGMVSIRSCLVEKLCCQFCPSFLFQLGNAFRFTSLMANAFSNDCQPVGGLYRNINSTRHLYHHTQKIHVAVRDQSDYETIEKYMEKCRCLNPDSSAWVLPNRFFNPLSIHTVATAGSTTTDKQGLVTSMEQPVASNMGISFDEW